MANFDRQANFEHDLLLFRCSSTHSITHSSRSQYASYGGRRHLSRMSSCELHSRSLAVGRTGAHAILRLRTHVMQSRDCLCNLRIPRMCNTISRLRKFPDCAEHLHSRNVRLRPKYAKVVGRGGIIHVTPREMAAWSVVNEKVE